MQLRLAKDRGTALLHSPNHAFKAGATALLTKAAEVLFHFSTSSQPAATSEPASSSQLATSAQSSLSLSSQSSSSSYSAASSQSSTSSHTTSTPQPSASSHGLISPPTAGAAVPLHHPSEPKRACSRLVLPTTSVDAPRSDINPAQACDWPSLSSACHFCVHI